MNSSNQTGVGEKPTNDLAARLHDKVDGSVPHVLAVSTNGLPPGQD